MKLIGLNEDYILMFGHEQNKQEHCHYGIQLLIPISSINLNGMTIKSSVLIDSNVDHFVYGDEEILSLLFHPESNIGRKIKKSFFKGEDEGIVCLKHLKIDCYAQEMRRNISEYKMIQRITNQVIAQLLLDPLLVCPIDDRISKINDHIQSSDFVNLCYENVIDRVFLSKSRLTHLFKEEMGIPLMKYITWKRLLHTSMQLLFSNMSITTAAHKYGFADASHFSRTFKNNFGINPREIFHKKLKDDRLVHVFTLDHSVK